MKTPALFKEYIWLVNTIYRAKRISLAEINDKWQRTEMSEGMPLSRTTFNRHKDAIEDIFGIYIDCDRKDGYRYYIGNEEVLHENSVQNWMLSTLTVYIEEDYVYMTHSSLWRLYYGAINDFDAGNPPLVVASLFSKMKTSQDGKAPSTSAWTWAR